MKSIVLEVDDNPIVAVGDTLLIYPDIGKPYEAEVIKIREDSMGNFRVSIQIPENFYTKKIFLKEDMEEWYTMGEMLINP